MNRYRVLIVDDEPGLRRTLERALRGHDYEVVSVGDPNSAYQVLGETHFDAVLLDLRLPQISWKNNFLPGHHFEAGRRWPGRVILMTGDLLPRQPDWPIELAGCPVLNKPFSLDTLTATVSGRSEILTRAPLRHPGRKLESMNPATQAPPGLPTTLREYRALAPWGLRDLAALAGGILDVSGVAPVNAAARARPSERTIQIQCGARAGESSRWDAALQPRLRLTVTCCRSWP